MSCEDFQRARGQGAHSLKEKDERQTSVCQGRDQREDMWSRDRSHAQTKEDIKSEMKEQIAPIAIIFCANESV